MQTTPLYAALLAFLFVALSYRVTQLRRSAQVALGDGGDKLLRRAIRVQGNFAEYVPFALLLLAMAELNGLGALWLHTLGAVLLVGRVVHAVGVSQPGEDLRLRVTGMVSTFGVLVSAAIANLLLL